MSKPIWFPFYPGDFLSSSRVALMTTEEIGGYLLLLCHCWQDPTCTIPADDESVRKLSRLTGSLETVKSCFIQKRGRLVNNRLYAEWEKVKEKSELAKKSVAIRWRNERNTNVKRTLYSSHRNIGTEEHRNRRTEEESELQSELRSSASATPRGSKKSVETWEAYRTAYARRYGVDPVRNQQVSSILCRFVDRIGVADAPQVAAFYLSHNAQWYVQKMHPVNLLLADAEKLRTEWATNRTVTTHAARQQDGKAARGQMYQEILDELKQEGTHGRIS